MDIVTLLIINLAGLALAVILIVGLTVAWLKAKSRAEKAERKIKVIAEAERLKVSSQKAIKRTWERGKAE